jgi:TonB-dependent SusC/RagA subfamily outer membrane receptor
MAIGRWGAVAGAACIVLASLASACRTTAPTTERPSGDATSRSSASDSEWTGNVATRVEELFVGRFPGVRVFYTPGQGISVRVRGSTSVMGSNEPLYILDGFPIEPGSGGLITINPSDIAKIEILKDAGSTAAYGVRGANGVVVITSKR